MKLSLANAVTLRVGINRNKDCLRTHQNKKAGQFLWPAFVTRCQGQFLVISLCFSNHGGDGAVAAGPALFVPMPAAVGLGVSCVVGLKPLLISSPPHPTENPAAIKNNPRSLSFIVNFQKLWKKSSRFKLRCTQLSIQNIVRHYEPIRLCTSRLNGIPTRIRTGCNLRTTGWQGVAGAEATNGSVG